MPRHGVAAGPLAAPAATCRDVGRRAGPRPRRERPAKPKLESVVKSIPPLERFAREAKRFLNDGERETFYALSPDALVAIVKAFTLQKAAQPQGRDLLGEHG